MSWFDERVKTHPAFMTMPKPVLRRGSRGKYVKEWQRIIGAKDDGIFGKITEDMTIAFQRKEGLSKVDGIVGNETWKAGIISTLPLDKKPGPKVEVLPIDKRLVTVTSNPSKAKRAVLKIAIGAMAIGAGFAIYKGVKETQKIKTQKQPA